MPLGLETSLGLCALAAGRMAEARRKPRVARRRRACRYLPRSRARVPVTRVRAARERLCAVTSDRQGGSGYRTSAAERLPSMRGG